MGGLAPGQLKSRRGWHSSPRRLHYRFSFFDRVSRTHCGKNSINFAGMAHSHRHRLAAAWPSLVRQIGPVLRRRRQKLAESFCLSAGNTLNDLTALLNASLDDFYTHHVLLPQERKDKHFDLVLGATADSGGAGQ